MTLSNFKDRKMVKQEGIKNKQTKQDKKHKKVGK